MKKNFLLIVYFSFCFAILSLPKDIFSQNVGIGTTNPLNKLHVAGGFRLDTLTGVGGNGLLRHDANGVVYGIRFTGNTGDVLRGDGTFGTGGAGLTAWSLTGNSGTNPATNFLGTTDNQPLSFRLNNSWAGQLNHITNNYGIGIGSLQSNTTGTQNVGFGRWALLSNTTGSSNASFGHDALSRNTTGSSNTAIGNWALLLNTNGSRNIAIGDNALSRNTWAGNNVAIGYWALLSNTDGYQNTAIGSETLYANLNGHDNSAIGFQTLNQNITGSYNNAFGVASLRFNTTGRDNNAFGFYALTQNTSGNGNTAMGNQALYSNLTGNNNVGIGSQSLLSNTNGYSNVAVGTYALRNNTTRSNLVAVGDSALYNNTSGTGNTALGSKALFKNEAGIYNTANGYQALYKNDAGSYNNAFGYQSLYNNTAGGQNIGIGNFSLYDNSSGSYNIAIGYLADVRNNGSFGIAIGTQVVASGGEIVLGNSFYNKFFCQAAYTATTASAPNMFIASNGQIMRSTSSARYKKEIADLEINTSKIYDLRPVSFNSIDGGDKRYFGLIAEEVAETIPELAEYAKEKDVIKGSTSEKLIPDAVQYSLLSVLLLEEVQKHENKIIAQQKMIEDQNKKITELTTAAEKQQKQIDDLLKRIGALEKK